MATATDVYLDFMRTVRDDETFALVVHARRPNLKLE